MKAAPTRAELEAAYARASFTLLGHLLFLGVCGVSLWLLRRALHLPPQTLGVVLLVALVVFSRDIFRWLRCRNALAASRS